MLTVRKTRRLAAIVAISFIVLAGPADAFFGFFDDWRQARKVKSYIRDVWGVTEIARLSNDTIRAILDASYSPHLSYLQLVGLFIRGDQMYELMREGKQADALYVGLKSGVNFSFVVLLRDAGLGGVGAIAQAAAAPIVWSLEKFMDDVSKAKLQRHVQAYFLLRGAPYNFSHDDIINKRDPTVTVEYTTDGWIWDIACDAIVSPMCRRDHFRVGGRPLDEGSAVDVYGMAKDLWDAAQEESEYGSEKADVKENVRLLLEDATCDSPGFQAGTSCSSGRPGVCAPGTWHCPRGAVKCVPNNKATREVCGDTLDNNCNGTINEDCGQLCGNTIREGDEQCDDGNTVDGDCCSATCQNEAAGSQVCGLGVCKQTVAQCDAGAPVTCVPGGPTEPGQEVSCSDTLDNDCDGEVDCADADCAQAPGCNPPVTCTNLVANGSFEADPVAAGSFSCLGDGAVCSGSMTGWT